MTRRSNARMKQPQIDRLRRLFETHGCLETVTAITGTCHETLKKYRDAGWVELPDPRTRPVPADFAFWANAEKIAELQQRYGCSRGLLRRWFAETSIKHEPQPADRVYERRDPPCRDELARNLKRFGRLGCAAHYGVHETTLRRWRRELGLPIEKRRQKSSNDNGIGWVERYIAERRAA